MKEAITNKLRNTFEAELVEAERPLLGDDPAAAGVQLAEAARILEEAGARNDLAKTRLAQAELRASGGDLAAARVLLERAGAVFEELGTLEGPDRARRLRETLAAG